ncbi:TRAP transporter substrate-binding protein [Ruixingdingia sedimenti]|uniref:TRAP transporter substrate-binding protein n=1 Tax=Ruixingdingia sedimenti TaxID=3073604 RepID=A0ABU1F3Q0_9RHOB|nr:TRAP transporter substrate-binding protein [Xinfangfangia sp. LG-4]MDR5651490.1 TRAP transporter substrate-binding protein [Xinfangfangia sp. LG-4]
MMLKKLGVVGALAGVCFTAASAMAETVTIKYSNWMPANYFAWTDVIQPWFAEIEQVTEGRVKIDILPKVVGTAASQFDVVRDGLADMAWFTAGFTPGRFPVSEFADLPLVSNSASIHAPIYDRVYRKHLADFNEYEGTQVLTIFPISPSQMFIRGKTVKTLEDLRGLKFRSPGNTVIAAVELLGGVPITKAPTEAYEMLSSGAIDGQITPGSSVVGFNQVDLTDSAYLLPGGLSNAICMILINDAVWARISEADRAAIQAISQDKLAAKFGAAWENKDKEALEVLSANPKYTIVEATDEDVAKLREILKPLEEAWVKRAKEKGFANPEAILADYRAQLAEAQPK